MTEPINIPINIRRGDTGDLERLIRQAQELRQALAHPIPLGQAPPPGWGTHPRSWPGFIGSSTAMPAEASGRWSPIEGGGPSRGYPSAAWARWQPPPPTIPPTPPPPELSGAGPASGAAFWRRVRPGGAIRPVEISPRQGPATALQTAWETLQQPQSRGEQHQARRQAQQAAQQMQQAQLLSILGQPTPLQQAWLAQQQQPPPSGLLPSQRAALTQAQRLSLLAQMPTPLQQAWMTLQQPQTPLQQQQGRAQATQVAQQMQRAQLLSILGQTPTPLQVAHSQLSTFATPLQLTHGYQRSFGVAQAQQGLQHAQLLSLFAQMGPQGPASPWAPGMNVPQGPSSIWAPGMNVPQGATSPWQAPPGTPPWTPQAPFSPWAPPSVPPSGPFSPWRPGQGSPHPWSPWPGPGGLPPHPRMPSADDLGGSGGLMATLGALLMLTHHDQEGLTQVKGMGPGGGKGGMALGVAGLFGGALKQGAGLAIGLSALQHLNQAMQAYETRHLGILDVGRQLDEQYEQIGTTLTYLERRYQVTGREGVAAMSALGRVTGTVAAASAAAVRAVRVGRAYGMSPEEAAQMQAQLIQYSPGGTAEPLALVGAYEQARRRGELSRMSFPRFGEAATQIAATGGLGRMMVSEEQAAEQTRMIAAFGGRYESNPGAAFQQYYERQYGPKSEMGETINYQALADVMRENPQGLQWGDRTLHPRTSYIDQQIIMQQGADIGQYRAAQFARARRQAGGNKALGVEYYMQATGTQDYAQGLREYERLEGQAAQPGGIAGAFKAPEAAQTGQAAVAEREGRPWVRGQEIRERQMTPEELAQTRVVQELEDARTKMLSGIQDVALKFNTSGTAAEALGKIFSELTTEGGKLKTALEEINTLRGQGGYQPGVAVPLDVDQYLGTATQPYPHPPSTPLPTQPRKSP